MMNGDLGTAAGRGDLVHLALRLIVEEALEGEVSDVLGRERYERGEGEKAGYRNGYRTGRMKTAEGAVDYSAPQVRDTPEPFVSSVRAALSGRTRELERLAVELYARGLSTRDIEDTFIDETGRRLLSRAAVSEITEKLWAEYEDFRTRFVVTNLSKRNARRLYEDVYCRRGQAENHIKSWKTHLAADRTSCSKATANQFRLFLHAGAYWLRWGLRVSMPKRSMWRVAQFDTLRLRLIKIAARVVEMKTMIRVHLPTSCPAQDILRFALGRIPRLVT